MKKTTSPQGQKTGQNQEDALKNYKRDILQEPLPEPLEKLLSSVQKGKRGPSPRTR